MKNNDVYLSFKTDRETCEMLTKIAHKLGKTQPELIEEICKDFIEDILSIVKEKIGDQPAPPEELKSRQ